MNKTQAKTDYTREELIEICEQSFVPQRRWGDRDSHATQMQLGEAYALLRDGCNFVVLTNGGLKTDDKTIWIQIESEGFAKFDWNGDNEKETYYLPTQERLNERKGSDWY